MAFAATLVLAGGGPVAAGIFVLAAMFGFTVAALLVLARRRLVWTLPAAAALAAVLVAWVRDAGGVTTLWEDAIVVSMLSVVGALFGAAPIAYTRWVLRVFDAAERRVANEQ